MHYWATWSGGVGVWHEDIDKLVGLQLNELFPQSALMFDIRSESEYIICNRKFQNMQNEDGKGGYDVFYAFAVEFPKTWQQLLSQKRISSETYDYVMCKMYDFIYDLYWHEVVHKSKHTFIIQNVRKSIMTNYGLDGYMKIVLKARRNRIKHLNLKIRKLLC